MFWLRTVTEWADKISTAAKSVRPDWDGGPVEGPAVIIDRLTSDLHADMAAEWRARRSMGRRLDGETGELGRNGNDR
jgi:hypothetical protein